MAITLDGTTGITTPTYGGATSAEYSVPVTGFKNRIINGAMGIWQRGTSFTNISAGTYSADRYVPSTSGINLTITQDTSVPSVAYKYSLKVVPASNATPTECIIRQFIEQQNIVDFAGQTVTGSAWVNCSKSSVKFRCATYNATGGGDVTQIISVTSATWTKITFSFSSFSAISAWTSTPNDKGGFLDIGFVDSTALTTSDYLYITGVQLEKGSTATSFDYRPYGTELSLCQRYFYWNGGTNDTSFFNVNSTNAAGAARYPAQMRAVPTVVIYNSTTSGQVSLIAGGTGTGVSTTIVSAGSIASISGTTLTGLGGCQFNYSVSAEL